MTDLTPCPPNCRYAGRIGADDCCDYWLITDRLRGCEGGANCMRYEPAHGNKPSRIYPDVRAQKRKSFDDNAALALWQDGRTDNDIAQTLCVSRYAVRCFRRRNNLRGTMAKRERAPKWDYTRMRELYDRGMNDKEIAEKIGCVHQTVNKWRRKTGLPSHFKEGKQ